MASSLPAGTWLGGGRMGPLGLLIRTSLEASDLGVLESLDFLHSGSQL